MLDGPVTVSSISIDITGYEDVLAGAVALANKQALTLDPQAIPQTGEQFLQALVLAQLEGFRGAIVSVAEAEQAFAARPVRRHFGLGSK